MKSIWCCISLSGGNVCRLIVNSGEFSNISSTGVKLCPYVCHGRPLHIKDITNNLVFVVIPIEKGIVQISLTSVFPTFSYPTYFVGIWVWIGLQMESLDNLAWDYILTTPASIITLHSQNVLLMWISWISMKRLEICKKMKNQNLCIVLKICV